MTAGLPGASVAERWRPDLAAGRDRLRDQYLQSPSPARLLRDHARLVDGVLRALWAELNPARGAALVATGGYGRGELFPYSDVDVLILLERAPNAQERERLERLVSLFWDVGLDVGHGVRTVEECLVAAEDDITVRTTLLESRLLCGSRARFRALCAALDAIIEPAAFFEAKRLEQEQRYARHQDTAYALEPNLKEAPGGLRDLHVIQWLGRASGVGSRWVDLEHSDLVDHAEAVQLARLERRLQDLRIRLHYLAGRREDRLVFDFQAALATQLGLKDSASRRASELMMQAYYRTAKAITQLNALLLQNFETRLVPAPDTRAHIINERFNVRGELLEAAHENVFQEDPRAILEAFLLMQQHHELRGMTAMTQRALWRARSRIDARFRRDAMARLLFLMLLQQPRGIVHELRRMNQYGVLGRYLPEFGRIVGQMQHDLFHVYTVDQHILMVVRNLRRFTMPELAHEFPLCTRLMGNFGRRWLLFIAALYHDIAKGRGGDHSELGARDAARFCRRHGLSAEDGALVAFLVEHHLTMSTVAQKKDVYDPEVVQAFAEQVGSERRLIALYLLTVADIRGTSPKVWNAWKAKLLEDLFRATRRALTGDAAPLDAVLSAKQDEAMRLLRLYALPEQAKDRLWGQLDTSYFLRHDAQEIAWQTRQLYARVDAQGTVVRARLAPIGEGLQVMVYAPDREALFAHICGYFERAGYTIAEAKIHTTRHGYALDTFLVLGRGPGVHYRDMIRILEKELSDELQSNAPLPPPRGGRLSRRVRHFPVSPVVDLRPDERGTYQVLSIVASDRPGLLYAIARVLAEHKVSLHTAKINTLGDRAEDVFLVSGETLTRPKAVLRLEQEMFQTLRVDDRGA
ncbi:MAG: protein-PII uridylyltransferase [Betaproteobacteria bacterium SG8_39]|nr:MAG: protein-PII uridylyltransferase [Betaproteobacteria bacterium SG8_39]